MTQSEKKYIELRKSIDKRSNQLHSLHKNHMQCKKGCDHCCMDYEIFPIEFDHIKNSIKDIDIRVEPSIGGSCIFLKDHVCQIYEHRPIICRTHGLPLLFMNDDQWELSVCELNFTNFDDEDFTVENTFPQDKFNSQLFMINKEYLKEIKSEKSEFDLFSMQKLKNEK